MYFTLHSHHLGSAVVGWGVGAAEQWRGRTVFGLRAVADEEVERWGFFFPSSLRLGKGGAWWEVKTYRCRGRRREKVCVGVGVTSEVDRQEGGLR